MKLEVIDGCFSYETGKNILEKICFEVNSGEIMTVLGQNGVGKTTLLKCIMGILKWKSGKTWIDGESVDQKGLFHRIAYVPQSHKVSFPYRAVDLVCMGRTKQMGFFSMPYKNDREKALKSLQDVGMKDDCWKECNTMSGGQLQLVYIARALISQPDILIMDEPEAHLDFKNQLNILTLIQRLVREKNMICIMNTHNPDHALRISSKTIVLGKREFCFGSTSDVLTSENINHYFEVDTQIFDLTSFGYPHKVFIYTSKEEGENE